MIFNHNKTIEKDANEVFNFMIKQIDEYETKIANYFEIVKFRNDTWIYYDFSQEGWSTLYLHNKMRYSLNRIKHNLRMQYFTGPLYCGFPTYYDVFINIGIPGKHLGLKHVDITQEDYYYHSINALEWSKNKEISIKNWTEEDYSIYLIENSNSDKFRQNDHLQVWA